MDEGNLFPIISLGSHFFPALALAFFFFRSSAAVAWGLLRVRVRPQPVPPFAISSNSRKGGRKEGSSCWHARMASGGREEWCRSEAEVEEWGRCSPPFRFIPLRETEATASTERRMSHFHFGFAVYEIWAQESKHDHHDTPVNAKPTGGAPVFLPIMTGLDETWAGNASVTGTQTIKPGTLKPHNLRSQDLKPRYFGNNEGASRWLLDLDATRPRCDGEIALGQEPPHWSFRAHKGAT